MEWKNIGGMMLGDREVPVRSLRFADDAGRIRRLRVSTVWKPEAVDFTRMPAVARLAKSKEGVLGIHVAGKNMGNVKIGKRYTVQPALLVAFNAVGKTVTRRLLSGTGYVVEEMDGLLIAREAREM